MGSKKKRVDTSTPIVGKLHYSNDRSKFRQAMDRRNGVTPSGGKGDLVAPKKRKPRAFVAAGKGGDEGARIARNNYLRGSARDKKQYEADLALYDKTKAANQANVDTVTATRDAQQGAGRRRPRSGLTRQGTSAGGRSSLNIRG